jgi:hypothetical protein
MPTNPLPLDLIGDHGFRPSFLWLKMQIIIEESGRTLFPGCCPIASFVICLYK